MVSQIEQLRRDFKGNNPELYRYISMIESSKALDSMGDEVSGYECSAHDAANKVWHRAGEYDRLAKRVADEFSS